MTAGKTHDTQHFIDSGNMLFKIDNLLGVTIGGDGSTSQEYYLGESYAQSSVHAIGGDISFSTIYDNQEFNELVAAVTDNPDIEPRYLVLAEQAPTMFRTMKVSWPQIGVEAPSDNAITRPWSLMRASIGDAGINVTKFEVVGQDRVVIDSDFSPDNGERAGIVITSMSDDVAGIEVAGRAGVPDYTDKVRPSIAMFDVRAGGPADLTMELTGTANSKITGYIVQGDREVVPNG